jgi:hypothetical protein
MTRNQGTCVRAYLRCNFERTKKSDIKMLFLQCTPLNGITDNGINWLKESNLYGLKSPKLLFHSYGTISSLAYRLITLTCTVEAA